MLTRHLHRGVHRRALHHIGIERHGKLTLLQAKVGTATKTTGGSHPSDRPVIATDVRRSQTGHLVHYQIEHTTYTFRIILHTWIGDHLDVFHRTGRHVLEDRRGIAAHHHVGLTIHIDLETAATVHRDVVVAIYRHHRHLTEHLQHRARFSVHIISRVIGHLIDLHLHQRSLRHHLNTLQLLHVFRDVDRVETHHCLPIQLEGDIFVGLTYRAEKYLVGTFAIHLLCEHAIHIRHVHRHRLLPIALFIDTDRSERFALLRQGIDHYTLDKGLLCRDTGRSHH